VALVQFAVSGATASEFQTANANYAAGRSTEAARGFEKIIAERGYSAPVLFNLGNASLKAGQPGRAILNYQRALLLAPDDAAIRSNLSVARRNAGVAASENRFWEKVARVLNLNTQAWILVWSTAIICAVVLASRFLPAFPRAAGRWVTVLAAISALAAALGMALQWPERNCAVVLEANTTAHIAPADASGVLLNLNAGETVRATKSHNGYTLVRLRDGRSGWVKNTAVARVI
jgi:tetratricopeptide (TPR) repeat protein